MSHWDKNLAFFILIDDLKSQDWKRIELLPLEFWKMYLMLIYKHKNFDHSSRPRIYRGDKISFTSLMLAKIPNNLSWKTRWSREKRMYYYFHSQGNLVFCTLSWAISKHKAWCFLILLAIFVQILGENVYFMCATFFSYFPHHFSELFYCSFQLIIWKERLSNEKNNSTFSEWYVTFLTCFLWQSPHLQWDI